MFYSQASSRRLIRAPDATATDAKAAVELAAEDANAKPDEDSRV